MSEELKAGVKSVPNSIILASVEELVAEGKSVDLRVKGSSMRPFVRNGQAVVLLKPIPEQGLRRGMVVMFRYNGQPVLHRIMRIEKGGRLYIEGDGNYRRVEVVEPEDVVAYVAEVELVGRKRKVVYGSPRWYVRSAWSLSVKALRTLAITVKRAIFG